MRFTTGKFSDLSLHPDYRWDSEYLCFEPYLNPRLNYIAIGDALRSSQYGVSIDMNEDGIGTKIYRMNEIGGILCDRNVSKYAELGETDKKAYKLYDRDVLFNRTNSQAFVGRTGLFRAYFHEDIVFASYLVRLRPNPDIVTPEYLTTFLNTKYGILDVKRRARISINQSNVNAQELKRVDIPLLANELQQGIVQLFDKAFDLAQASDELYLQAQTLLLSDLDLAGWKPNHRLSFTVNSSDLQQAGRVDADYFQPKYEEIVSAIKNYPGGWDILDHVVRIKDTNVLPDDDAEYKYIELANISGYGEINECTREMGRDLPSRARRRVTTGDVIVSSVEGSLSSIALIGPEYNQALCSTGFHVINANTVNAESLLVFLKSLPGRLQLKQGCSGTILTAINKNAFKKVVLPKISEQVQAQIQKAITGSIVLRQESRRLLECAKCAVEIAIEQDEATAQTWLDKETS